MREILAAAWLTAGRWRHPADCSAFARRTITWIAGRRIGSRDDSDRRCRWRCWRGWTDKTSGGVFETKSQVSRPSRARCVISIPAYPLPSQPPTLRPSNARTTRCFPFSSQQSHLCCSLLPSPHHLCTPSCSAILLLFLSFFVIRSCQANRRLPSRHI